MTAFLFFLQNPHCPFSVNANENIKLQPMKPQFLAALLPLPLLFPQESCAQTYPSTLTLTSTMGAPVEMVLVEAGSFYMGSQSSDPSAPNYNTYRPSYNEDEGPVHQVSLSAFYICKYEVTNEVWADVMGGDVDDDTRDYAHGGVSYYDALSFVDAAAYSYNNIPTNSSIALPTEEQWEYAARGGSRSDSYVFAGSNTANDVAVWGGTTTTPIKVGTKAPNAIGLYDMSGNAREWTQTDYYNYSDGSPISTYYTTKVQRGGDTGSRFANLVTVSNRAYSKVDYAAPEFGLRFVINLPEQSTAISEPKTATPPHPTLVIRGGKILVLQPDGKYVDMAGRQCRP